MKRLNVVRVIFLLALTLGGMGARAYAFPDDSAPVDDPLPASGATAVGVSPSPIELRAVAVMPPNPLEVLPIRLTSVTVADAVSKSYARVTTPDAPVYNAPGGAVIRTMGTGFIFVSTGGSQHANGESWTAINHGEWIRTADLTWREPSKFHGVLFDDWPDYEFAWVLQPNQPLLTPGGEPNKAAPFLERYQMVSLYATEWVGEWRYYMIAPDQWAKESWLGKVRMNPVPEGVSGRWIDIDLYEQTLTAYVNETPVFATLVASGLEQWSTSEGLFQVWSKVADTPMSGSEGKPDYYYLENVPWNLFFNGEAALHGAYWHDGFGYRRSHGCVNLAPADSLWLFNWADEGTWVHVHSSHEYR